MSPVTIRDNRPIDPIGLFGLDALISKGEDRESIVSQGWAVEGPMGGRRERCRRQDCLGLRTLPPMSRLQSQPVFPSRGRGHVLRSGGGQNLAAHRNVHRRSDRNAGRIVTPKQFQSAIDRLGLSQVGAARLVGADPRTARKWAAGDNAVPECVAILLRLLLAGKITVADVEAHKR